MLSGFVEFVCLVLVGKGGWWVAAGGTKCRWDRHLVAGAWWGVVEKGVRRCWDGGGEGCAGGGKGAGGEC